jgi:hypothetical protein
MLPIGHLVDNLLKPLLKDYFPTILILNRNWENIIGAKYHQYCKAHKVSFKKNEKSKGILYIDAFNSVVSFYIKNNENILIEKMNTIFGNDMIGSIKIKQDPRIIK